MSESFFVDMDVAVSPEEKLMLGVAKAMVHDYIYSKPPSRHRTAREYHLCIYNKRMREAVNYLFVNNDMMTVDEKGEKRVYMFSFPFICHWFGIPIEQARKHILEQRTNVCKGKGE